MSKLRVHERDDLRPICPHCEREIDSLLSNKLDSSFLSARSVYCCPQCKKILGMSHRKGLLAS